MKAENLVNESCLQRNSAEHEKYVGGPSAGARESKKRTVQALYQKLSDTRTSEEGWSLHSND